MGELEFGCRWVTGEMMVRVPRWGSWSFRLHVGEMMGEMMGEGSNFQEWVVAN